MRVMSLMVVAVLLAACKDSTGSGDDGPAPALPPANPATVLVEDNFDKENGAKGVLDWVGSSRWSIVSGCVDLHGNGFYDVQPGSGLYVDLDGSCGVAGTLESKTPLALEATTHILEFTLGGNGRSEKADTVVVSVGTLFSEQVVMAGSAKFTQFTREITVAAPTSAAIRFAHKGGDRDGLLLDLVRLRRK